MAAVCNRRLIITSPVQSLELLASSGIIVSGNLSASVEFAMKGIGRMAIPQPSRFSTRRSCHQPVPPLGSLTTNRRAFHRLRRLYMPVVSSVQNTLNAIDTMWVRSLLKQPVHICMPGLPTFRYRWRYSKPTVIDNGRCLRSQSLCHR